jgi:hypothetical protein
MGRSVQYALFVFFWLVAIVFHALLALAYVCLIMVAAMDGGDLAVVAALLLGGIGVVVLRVLYGLVAVAVADLVARLVDGTAVAPR